MSGIDKFMSLQGRVRWGAQPAARRAWVESGGLGTWVRKSSAHVLPGQASQGSVSSSDRRSRSCRQLPRAPAWASACGCPARVFLGRGCLSFVETRVSRPVYSPAPSTPRPVHRGLAASSWQPPAARRTSMGNGQQHGSF